MVKKAGRPPGAQNKVGKDEKEFIKGLLGDTQEQYREAFLYYANNACRNADDRKFILSSTKIKKHLKTRLMPP